MKSEDLKPGSPVRRVILRKRLAEICGEKKIGEILAATDYGAPLASGDALVVTSSGGKGDTPEDYARVSDATPYDPLRKGLFVTRAEEAPYAVVELAGDVVVKGVTVIGAYAAAPGFDRSKAVLIHSHENELTHPVSNRESYWEIYEKKSRLGDKSFPWPQVRPLGYGESIVVECK